KHGWAVGEHGYIYATGDGGVTWTKQAGHFDLSEETGNPVGEAFLFGVAAVDPKTAWVVGIDGYVAKTEDGGTTWRRVVTPAPRTQLFSVMADISGKVLIAGNGILLVSGNGGRTWQAPEFNPPIAHGWIYGLTRRGASGFVAVGGAQSIYVADHDQTSIRWRSQAGEQLY
ncbi:MAG: hypothetical protein HQK60_08395, partial [Deltaproteobacteria bacterium]|nr:hypothetical protein [Deltaproteobacteria bacterium]